MNRSSLRPVLVVLALVIASAMGCGKKGGGAAAGPRPAKPADGTPLVAQFVELGKDKHGETEARFDLFSFADKDANRTMGTLHYLDATGKEVGNFPWSQQTNPVLVSKGGSTRIHAGFNIPPATKTVTMTFEEVDFTDGSKWAAAAPAAPAGQ